MIRRNVTVYRPGEMPDVEVQLEDGQWTRGEARMRWQEGDNPVWWFNVAWRPPGSHTRKLGNFDYPARVRLITRDLDLEPVIAADRRRMTDADFDAMSIEAEHGAG